MSARPTNDDDFRLVAERYRALHEALTTNSGAPRDPAQIRLLTNGIRDALDRACAEISPSAPPLIANSFWSDGPLHDGARTQVMRLRHRDLDLVYALKTLPAQQFAISPAAREGMLREAAIQAGICHPAIVRLHTVLRLEDGRPGLLLEYLPETLSARLARTTFSCRDILRLMERLCAGLQAVHAAGYVHGDICPANLLADGGADFDLKIADFGISIPTGCKHADFGYEDARNPDFSAPEQYDGRALDARTDIFSCGRILQIMIESAVLQANERAMLETRLATFLHRDPDRRPQTCAAAIEFLQSGFPRFG